MGGRKRWVKTPRASRLFPRSGVRRFYRRRPAIELPHGMQRPSEWGWTTQSRKENVVVFVAYMKRRERARPNETPLMGDGKRWVKTPRASHLFKRSGVQRFVGADNPWNFHTQCNAPPRVDRFWDNKPPVSARPVS